MKVHKWDDIKNGKLSPEQIARADRKLKRDIVRMRLRELRMMAGKTQAEMAEITKLTQSSLSRIERRDDTPIPTLRRYVEALGGELEVVAVIGNKRVTLAGI